jgi:hypothetical protein
VHVGLLAPNVCVIYSDQAFQVYQHKYSIRLEVLSLKTDDEDLDYYAYITI